MIMCYTNRDLHYSYNGNIDDSEVSLSDCFMVLACLGCLRKRSAKLALLFHCKMYLLFHKCRT